MAGRCKHAPATQKHATEAQTDPAAVLLHQCRYEVHGAESSDDEGEESGSEAEGSEEEGSEGEDQQEASGNDDEGSSGSEGHAAGAQRAKQHNHDHSHAHGHKHGGCCGGGAGCGGHHSHDHKHGSAAEQQGEGAHGEHAEEEALPAVMASGPASIYGLHSGERWSAPQCRAGCYPATCCSLFLVLHMPSCWGAQRSTAHLACVYQGSSNSPSCPVAANGLHLRLQMGIVDRDEETLEIVAPSAIPAGEEVHNT